ncbi:hypothetical protein [Enterococcus faecium]|uniref:Conjugal transfer protein n=1 Tax=Enterococcus faecium TaxID=1352 RepID=A0A242B092_ENTFC|nr:hypothetical protein [Enterococcus faecium]OTN86657.1 hypothetical protein A5810_003002 [Enterococcus faecium]OTN86733.1 hypothetical protein A5809_002832 [Enterococcus faecium]
MFDFLKSTPKKAKNQSSTDHAQEIIYWEDQSRLQGVYKDFFVVYQPEKKQFSLVSMLKVDGLNVDTLTVAEQDGLTEDFGVFLSQNVLYEPAITSKNVPVAIDDFVEQWETTVENYRKMPGHNESLLQLKASYYYHYRNLANNMETSKKQHFVINSEPISEENYESLEQSYQILRDKTRTIRTALIAFLSKYDCQVDICTVGEMKKVLNS